MVQKGVNPARHPKSQSVELQWKKIAGFNKIIASNA